MATKLGSKPAKAIRTGSMRIPSVERLESVRTLYCAESKAALR
jgi:hypothetical protein